MQLLCVMIEDVWFELVFDQLIMWFMKVDVVECYIWCVKVDYQVSVVVEFYEVVIIEC